MTPWLLAAFAGGPVPIINISGETISSQEEDPSDSYARLRVGDDGNIYRSLDQGSASWVQIDTLTDWIRPVFLAPDDYEVRFTSLTGDALTSSTVTENTWHPLSSGDFILVQSDTVLGGGSNSSTFTVELRRGSGSVLDSASYTLTAEVTAGA